MNETLKEMVELAKKAETLCKVMKDKNTELKNIIDTDNETKFRRMCDDVNKLKEIFNDLNLKSAHMETSLSGSYGHIGIGFNSVLKGFQVYDSTIYVSWVDINAKFIDVGTFLTEKGLIIKDVTLLMNNWDTAYEEIQNEFAKEIRRKIDLNIKNKINEYNYLSEEVEKIKRG